MSSEQKQKDIRWQELEASLRMYYHKNILPSFSKEADKQKSDKESFFGYALDAALNGAAAQVGMGGTVGGGTDFREIKKSASTWDIKTTEQFLTDFKQSMQHDKQLQGDMMYLAAEWRDHFIQRMGSERYKAVSKQMNADLAATYVEYRMERQFIHTLAEQHMPQSSLDYVLKKAGTHTLMGGFTNLFKGDIDKEVERLIEQKYKPSVAEKVLGFAGGVTADTLSSGGIGSWKSLLAYAGLEATDVAADYLLTSDRENNEQSLEALLSKNILGEKRNVISVLNQQSLSLDAPESDYLQSLNQNLMKPFQLVSKEANQTYKDAMAVSPWNKNHVPSKAAAEWQTTSIGADKKKKGKTVSKETDRVAIPSWVRPEQREAYLHDQALLRKKEIKNETLSVEKTNGEAEVETQPANELPSEAQVIDEQPIPSKTDEVSPWEELLKTFGYDGMGNTLQNLGFTIAMLPDILLGTAAGKDSRLTISDNLLPLGALLMGMHTQSPFMKLILMGAGAANLFNKFGKEASESMQEQSNSNQYRTYADEPLNSRLTNPELKGEYLLVNVDGVPGSIHLPKPALEAYAAGALPLSTLANAVLVKSDELRNKSQENYETVRMEDRAQNLASTMSIK